MHFHIVLVEPEIPQNTGNIGRLCVATNTTLHLIEPLGFDLSEKAVRRSGLDYWKFVDLKTYPSFSDFKQKTPLDSRLWFFTKFAKNGLYKTKFLDGDYFIFGKETKGLPPAIHEQEQPDSLIKIPMFSEKIRSLNLANSASIVLYEAIRQYQEAVMI